MKCTKCGEALSPVEALDCPACHKDFCTECIDDHPCGASIGGQAKAVVLKEKEIPTSPLQPKVLGEQFLALGTEKWREYIDLDRQHLGKTAIDQGGGPEGLREAFSENMDRGVQFAAAQLGKALTLKLYQTLFEWCAGHLKSECRYRVKQDGITLGTDVPMSETAVAELTNQSGAMRGVNGHERSSEGDLIVMHFPAFMPELIERLFTEFHLELMAADTDLEKRLLAIAKLIQNLERLHPFRNANGRTNILLMNKLLTEWGFHPAILDDPNEAPFLSVAVWRDKIRKGMFRWAIVCAGIVQKRQVSPGLSSFSSFSFPFSPSLSPHTVQINGHAFDVGSSSGSALECLFDSVRQGLPLMHPQRALSGVELRDWLVAQYQQQQGAVPTSHIVELSRGGMGNLANDVPALAARLGVRIRIFVQGSSGDVWLEFDSAGGAHLPVINILHQGVHFVPLTQHVPQQLPQIQGPTLPLGFGQPALQSSPHGGSSKLRTTSGLLVLDDRPTASERFGGRGSVIRTYERRKVDGVSSPIRRQRSAERDRSPRRDTCDFCGHSTSDGRRVECVTSRSCSAWRLACDDCYRVHRRSYRCKRHAL